MLLIGVCLNTLAQNAPPKLPCERADLIVSSMSWNEATERLTIDIMNRGGGEATDFLLYAEAESETNSAANPICQSRVRVQALAAGASLSRTFTFTSLSCRRRLSNANQFRARVDPKNTVCECVESNNDEFTIERHGF